MKKTIMILLCLMLLCSCAKQQPVADVDVDLTALSGTMCYAQVNDMVNLEPEKYIGKTVRMKGSFAVSTNTETPFFACLIADATACCQQGIEFVWAGEHKYPDDYPERGAEITVTGVFASYQDAGMTYYTLRDAQVSF